MMALAGVSCGISSYTYAKKLFKYNILYSFIFRYQKFM